MENLVAMSPADERNFFFATNLSSVTPLKVVSLDADGNYNGPNNFNVPFSGSLVIIIVGMLGFLFFIGVLLIIICCRSTNGQRSIRAYRRAGGNNIVQRVATEGLERTIIESFPVFSYNLVKGLKAQAKGSECAVCLSDFEDEEMVRLIPKCSHAFHPECIDMWLCSHTTCPVCRTSLLPADTEFGVVEPQTPPEQVTIVIDDGAELSRHGSVRRDISNGEATNGAPETSNDSTGHSLVRVQKELEQPTEWYIATTGGLTPALHRSCSFVARHHSQGPSSSKARPACSKAGGSMQDEAGCRSRSERWGSISMNPASVGRTLSERVAAQPREQREVDQQRDRKAYLKRTLSWLIGGNRDRAEGSQNGSGSSRQVNQIVGMSTV